MLKPDDTTMRSTETVGSTSWSNLDIRLSLAGVEIFRQVSSTPIRCCDSRRHGYPVGLAARLARNMT